ncbi:MAG: hypothetical protein ACI3ZF_01660, partial [Candidatus Cryptobacteroides sp.]
ISLLFPSVLPTTIPEASKNMGIFDDLINIEEVEAVKKDADDKHEEQQEEHQEERSIKNSLYGEAFRKAFGEPR